MTAIPLHPPVPEAKISYDPRVPGEPLINIGGVVSIIKAGETPQARALYRLYLAEYRAIASQPISDDERAQRAMLAAMERFGLRLVEAPTPDAG